MSTAQGSAICACIVFAPQMTWGGALIIGGSLLIIAVISKLID